MHASRAQLTRLRGVALLVVVGTLALAATTTTGVEPTPVAPISDSAFGPVVLPPNTVTPTAPGLSSGLPRGLPAPTASLRPLAEPHVPTAPAPRPQPSLPTPRPIIVPNLPKTTHSISGRASWYCNSDNGSLPRSICHNAYPDGPGMDAYAAAGPGLRAAIGASWRGTRIVVCGRKCVVVRLVDWCKCTGGSVGVEKLIDLYSDVYQLTGSRVTIRW